jgi:hypothetical protein
MSKSTTFESSLLQLIFLNTAVANIGNSGGLLGSSVAGNFYISLHTADPHAGNQSTSECNYTGYARVAVTRTSGDWGIASNVISNINPIVFPTCTGGTNSVTYFGVGVASSGGSLLLYSGAVTTPLSVSNGITPSFAASELTVSEV